MPSKQHMALVQAWMERIHEVGIVNALNELATPDLQLENADGNADIEGVRVRFTDFERAFPDAEASVEEVLSDGNRLMLVLEFNATHLGPLRNIPPTGRPVCFQAAFLMEVDGQYVRRLRTYPEFYSVMEQIGVFPRIDERSSTPVADSNAT